jgi:penicillin-binding protein 1C
VNRAWWLAPPALLAAAAIGAWAWLHVPVPVPTFAAARAAYLPSEAWLLDRHGEPLDVQRIGFDYRRLAWVPLDQVSPAFIEALVAGEDRRFREHAGVDWRAVFGALRDRLLHGRHRGASTLSMQLANLLLRQQGHAPAAGWRGKVAQARMALSIERRWSKPQLLEAYVNLLGFRGELQGIGAAARVLAGREPSGLPMDESLVLAALLPRPSADAAQVARRACARARQLVAAPGCAGLQAVAARMLGVADAPVQEHLAPQVARQLLHAPGERVRATLDATLQRQAIEVLRTHLADLAGHNVRDGAALVVDNGTGEVLAYVASGGPHSRSPQVDGVHAPRQAGSTLKPFLYGLAIARGYLDAASLLDDAPLDVATGSGAYVPQDYEQDYKGLVSVRTALAGSLNVPAVRTLMLYGLEPFAQGLRSFGYEGVTHPGDYYGYSLALGSAEVTLWQQAQAYRALARGGQFAPLRPLRLASEQGDAPAPSPSRTSPPAGVQPLSPAAAFVVSDILADRGARAVTFGLGNHLETPFWSAAKTGTSKDMRDNWCIGYTQHYTVAVWVGNFEGDPMLEVSGVTGAAPVWHALMLALEPRERASTPRVPAGLVRSAVRYQPAVEPARMDYFLAGRERGLVEAIGDAGVARIESPQQGALLALDPDIDPRHQRVAIRVRGARSGLLLRMDGQPLGDPAGHAAALVLWAPARGAHELALEESSGRALDTVRFSVR